MADEAKAQQGGRETEGHLGRPPRKTAMADVSLSVAILMSWNYFLG